MVEKFNTIGKALIALALIDLFVVLMTMVQIGQGIDTPHIAFWDVQIKFIAHIMGA